MTLPAWANPSCANITALAFVYGGLSRLVGADRLLPLPPGVHWGVAGAIADSQCKGWVIPGFDQELAMAAASGYAGGFVGSMLFG